MLRGGRPLGQVTNRDSRDTRRMPRGSPDLRRIGTSRSPAACKGGTRGRWLARSSGCEVLGHVLDSWVFGQHVYWAVGRGLADARARGRTILRLKVTLEEPGGP